ncbi:GIY-YIG nuclease family protein [Bacillus sp. CMF12]|uniref:GIY-YIG nuclease family protein n=1 Tax=Bacillaceae TaxID=186817 RepID=UPI001FB32CBB|nr:MULTISPECIES: GIY-YIG nuclease family protein [Bacillaceae]MDF2037334.1 GIY-YIG nuclease family protein [Cytobacillus oceanisediminis]UOE55549.1 GIY-YIG nuclease family protein [Cytobacillus oceanisediminis]USK50007.1 GIY-YIG nuclease family protein [Bacillus sp. CMF12]
MENSHYFYVLHCRDGSLYAGYTNDLEKRVKAHNEGKGAKYTRGRGPVDLVFSRSFSEKGEAMRAEYEFKQWPRKKKEEFLMKETGGTYVAAKKL